MVLTSAGVSSLLAQQVPCSHATAPQLRRRSSRRPPLKLAGTACRFGLACLPAAHCCLQRARHWQARRRQASSAGSSHRAWRRCVAAFSSGEAAEEQPVAQQRSEEPSEEPSVHGLSDNTAQLRTSPSDLPAAGPTASAEGSALSRPVEADTGEQEVESTLKPSSTDQAGELDDLDEMEQKVEARIQTEWGASARHGEPKPPPAFLADPLVKPDGELPIWGLREELQEAIARQRVTILVGGTGCGKSTQVPQFILQEAAAKQLPASVWVTQPRRMAATSLARRVAEETGMTMGHEVGYRIRGEVVPGDHLSFVTAGYLLSWLTVAPAAFQHVTHIILDEAHIQSSDMELLLLLVRLLMRLYSGPKLILMSATMQASFLSEYLSEFGPTPGTPITPISVGDRLFPVEVLHLDALANGTAPQGRKLPERLHQQAMKCSKKVFPDNIFEDKGTDDLPAKVYPEMRILVQELIPAVAEGGSTILVFVPGYADLARIHSWLYWNLPIAGSVNIGSQVPPKPRRLRDESEGEEEEDEELTESEDAEGAGASFEAEGRAEKFRLFALHSQVAGEEQELVLEKPEPNVCNIVLATTIAESSLTLPQVTGVIDFGVHRTTKGDPRQMGLTKLATEWCARSALLQREGRAGRTRPGWCIRLVPEKFFDEKMPEFEQPEILRIPLTKLFLQAKGMADGLRRVAQEDPETANLLGNVSAGQLLEQLPSPPSKVALAQAVHELATLSVLTEDTESAEATVLGSLALFLPLDVQLCRLVWLGALWGCPAEAVVLAAACSSGAPFLQPSRLSFGDNAEFISHLRPTAESRKDYEGGHFSEPIMCLRVFCAWLRRLASTSRAGRYTRWCKATAMLCQDAAVDESKMQSFLQNVADLAIRARDMTSDECSEENQCPVRQDLHNLLKLLRRPDLSNEEQKAIADIDEVPKIGDVFRAPARKLYALLAAALSNQLLVGSHRYAKQSRNLEAMLNALEMLGSSGIASKDAILIPQRYERRLSEEKATEIVAALVGEEPKEVKVNKSYIAACFRSEKEEEAPAWLQAAPQARGRRFKDPRNYGLAAAESQRSFSVDFLPRLCHMAFGGLRECSVEDVTLSRAVSPYELEFNLVHAVNASGFVPGIFGEQTPMGLTCHITSPEVPLGIDSFACVASNMTLAEYGSAVRAFNPTLLTAEELVFALTTLCPSGLHLQLGFGLGPGGSDADARAVLTAIRFQRGRKPVELKHALPGLATIEKANQVREIVHDALVSPSEQNSLGTEILLWQDDEAQNAVEELVDILEAASTKSDDLGSSNAAAAASADRSVVWITYKPSLRKDEEDMQKELATDVDDDDTVEVEMEEVAVQAMQPIGLPHWVETKVAQRASFSSPKLKHRHECPDCGERFKDWKSAKEHFELTGHLDVSTRAAEIKAQKSLADPVRYRCHECFQGFSSWEACQRHLEETQHLSFCDAKTQRLLCLPKLTPGLDDVEWSSDSEEETQDHRQSSSSSAASPSTSSTAPAVVSPERKPARRARRLPVPPNVKLETQSSAPDDAQDERPVAGSTMSIEEADLDDKSKAALRTLPPRAVQEILERSKSESVRNRNAYVTGAVEAAKQSGNKDEKNGITASPHGAEHELDQKMQHPDKSVEDMIAGSGLGEGAKDALRKISKEDAVDILEKVRKESKSSKWVKDVTSYLLKFGKQQQSPSAQEQKMQPPDKSEEEDDFSKVGNVIRLFNEVSGDVSAMTAIAEKAADKVDNPKGALYHMVQKYAGRHIKPGDVMRTLADESGPGWIAEVSLQGLQKSASGSSGVSPVFRSDSAKTKKAAEAFAARAALRGLSSVLR